MSVSGLKLLRCQQCAAGLNHLPNQALLSCAFCGSTYLAEGAPLQGGVPPVQMISFAVEPGTARQNLTRWMGEGLFRPGDVVATSKILERGPVFLPVYCAAANARSNWVAQITVRQKNHWVDTASVEARSLSHWDEQTHLLSGQHDGKYRNLTMLASLGALEDLYSDIAEYPWDRLVPFSVEAVGNATVEEPVVTPQEARNQIHRMVEDEETLACTAMIPGTPTDLRVSTTVDIESCDLVYVPVYPLSFEYDGSTYNALVNGATGGVGGQGPVSAQRLVVAIGTGAVLTLAVLWLLRRWR